MLCVRDVAERELSAAVAHSRLAGNKLLRAARKLSPEQSLIEFESTKDCEWIMNAVLHHVSKICGPLFLAQAISGQIREKKFVTAITCERYVRNRASGRKIRIQLILEEDLQNVCGQNGSCLIWKLEEDSKSYRLRSNTMREVAQAWAASHQGNGNARRAIGRASLAGLV